MRIMNLCNIADYEIISVRIFVAKFAVLSVDCDVGAPGWIRRGTTALWER